LAATAINRKFIQEEIKKRLNSGKACYNSFQNLLSSRLLSKNTKIKIYNIIILSNVPYECETCSLASGEELYCGYLRTG
jgi:hypothetical protein